MLLSIQHQKGGVGKSTLAWNLALSLQNSNKIIEVVDLDAQQTITLNNLNRIEKKLKPMNIKTFKSVEALKSYYEGDNPDKIILVDTGGFDSAYNRLTALVSDHIFTPVSDTIFDLQGLKTYEKVLREVSDQAGTLITTNVIFSLIDPRKKTLGELKEYVEKSQHFHSFDSIIRRRTDFVGSIVFSKSIMEYKPSSIAGIEFNAVYKEFLEVING